MKAVLPHYYLQTSYEFHTAGAGQLPPSFGVMLLYLPVIVQRIRSEEQVLKKGLTEYAEYKIRV